MLLIERVVGDLSGLNAVVVGRSNIVGKPMANLLLAPTAPSPSPTAAPGTCRRGPPRRHPGRRRRPAQMVKGDWVKPGATVIDVGINRTERGIVGDVDFAGRQGGRRHYAGAWRRRPDDHRLLMRNTFVSAARREGFHYEKSL